MGRRMNAIKGSKYDDNVPVWLRITEYEPLGSATKQVEYEIQKGNEAKTIVGKKNIAEFLGISGSYVSQLLREKKRYKGWQIKRINQ